MCVLLTTEIDPATFIIIVSTRGGTVQTKSSLAGGNVAVFIIVLAIVLSAHARCNKASGCIRQTGSQSSTSVSHCRSILARLISHACHLKAACCKLRIDWRRSLYDWTLSGVPPVVCCLKIGNYRDIRSELKMRTRR